MRACLIFALTLLFGFEPELDRKELLETDELSEGEGPRANLKTPEESLMLHKPTSEDEHEGGQRMKVGSWQYNVFRAWIAAGGKFDPERESKLVRFELQPAELVVVDRDQANTVRAMAWFDDGTVENVTALTTFSSNDDGIAAVDPEGTIRVQRTGDTSVIAQYAGGVASTQVLVPAADIDAPFPPFPCHNRIDEYIAAKLQKLNIHPSQLCSDEDYLRRVYLDVIGTLPTPDEARTFLADRDPEKRQILVDRLLDRPEYAIYWAMKLSDWTGNSKYISRNPQQWNWAWLKALIVPASATCKRVTVRSLRSNIRITARWSPKSIERRRACRPMCCCPVAGAIPRHTRRGILVSHTVHFRRWEIPTRRIIVFAHLPRRLGRRWRHSNPAASCWLASTPRFLELTCKTPNSPG